MNTSFLAGEVTKVSPGLQMLLLSVLPEAKPALHKAAP